MTQQTITPAPIYWEDVEYFRLTGSTTKTVVPYFFRSEQAAGLLRQLKSGQLTAGTTADSMLAQLGSNMSRQTIPRAYAQTLWTRALYLANVSGPDPDVFTFAANPSKVPPSQWGPFVGAVPDLAPNPGPVQGTIFPPYQDVQPVTPAGNAVPSCNGTYPSVGQECEWPHPQGGGATVTLSGPPDPSRRSFFPCPPGYVPDPATGKCVAATDARWAQIYPSAAPNSTQPVGSPAPIPVTPQVSGQIAPNPPLAGGNSVSVGVFIPDDVPVGTGGYYPGSVSVTPATPATPAPSSSAGLGTTGSVSTPAVTAGPTATGQAPAPASSASPNGSASPSRGWLVALAVVVAVLIVGGKR